MNKEECRRVSLNVQLIVTVRGIYVEIYLNVILFPVIVFFLIEKIW